MQCNLASNPTPSGVLFKNAIRLTPEVLSYLHMFSRIVNRTGDGRLID